jgi:hypothetical protein
VGNKGKRQQEPLTDVGYHPTLCEQRASQRMCMEEEHGPGMYK